MRSLRMASAVMVLMMLGLVSLVTPSAQAAQLPGTWHTGAPAPSARSEVGVARVGDNAYVVGDYNGATQLLIYDLANNRWREGAPFPHPVHHAAVASIGSTIFVFGGYVDGWTASKEVWAYHVGTDTWHRLSDMPFGLAAGGTAVINGKIHLLGGSGSGRVNIAAHEVYDPTADAWAGAPPIPHPRDHLVVAAIGNQIVAVGGRIDGSPSKSLGYTEIYDPRSKAWREARPMLTPRSGSASAVLNGILYVFGGEGVFKTFSEVEAYDLAKNQWTSYQTLPTPRHGFGAVAYGDKIYTLVGSPTPGGDRSTVVEIFQPQTGTDK